MPDQTQPAVGRVCPSCGRRVPRSVAKCRCGAELPADLSPSLPAYSSSSAASGGSSANFVVPVVLGIVAILGVGYWTLFRDAPEPQAPRVIDISTPRVSPTASEASSPAPAASAPAPTAAPATPGGASGAAQAWNAAANAQAATPVAAAAAPISALPTTAAPAPGVSGSMEEMIDRVMPAVVLIETSSGRGSGFFVQRDTLITNVHVVQNDGYVTLRRLDGTSLNARVESRAPAFDIAILKVAQPSPTQAVIPMGNAQSLRPGQEIIVIGSALGTLQNSVSRGIVSGLRTSGGATLVQTDAAVNPGNSGGPMLDRSGSVVGITTMGFRGAEGLNFGVAINHARDLLEGRQTNLGTSRGLTEIQSQTGGSESERQQQQGDQQLRSQIGELEQAATRLDGAWLRFRQQCYKSPISARYDREWFAVLVPGGIPGDAASGCTSYFSAMESDIRQFKSLMQRMMDDARRANVMPGTIRDLLRANRLDFEWGR